MSLPARAPSIPRGLGYPGLGGTTSPHPPLAPRHAAPRVSPCQLWPGAECGGDNSRAMIPKIPPASPKWPDPGCQVPPAASQARVRGAACSITFVGWAEPVRPPPEPPDPPSPCTGVRHWPQGLPKPVAAPLWNECRAPGSSQPPQRRLSAPPRHKKKEGKGGRWMLRAPPARPPSPRTQKPL